MSLLSVLVCAFFCSLSPRDSRQQISLRKNFVLFNPTRGDFRHFFAQYFLPPAPLFARLHKSGAIRIIVLNCAELSPLAARLSTNLSTSLLKT
jgi:hypothetical protein